MLLNKRKRSLSTGPPRRHRPLNRPKTQKYRALESHPPIPATRPDIERVLFVDQSTTNCGVCYAQFFGDPAQPMKLDVMLLISPKRSLHITERVTNIITSLGEFVSNWQVDAVCIEDTQFSGGRTHGNRATDEAMSAISFAIRTLCHQRKIAFYKQSPSMVKLAGTGDGHATKDDMIWAASKLIGQPVLSGDLADAILAAKSWSINRERIISPPKRLKRKLFPKMKALF